MIKTAMQYANEARNYTIAGVLGIIALAVQYAILTQVSFEGALNFGHLILLILTIAAFVTPIATAADANTALNHMQNTCDSTLSHKQKYGYASAVYGILTPLTVANGLCIHLANADFDISDSLKVYAKVADWKDADLEEMGATVLAYVIEYAPYAMYIFGAVCAVKFMVSISGYVSCEDTDTPDVPPTHVKENTECRSRPCPKCGEPLTYTKETESFFCLACDTEFEVRRAEKPTTEKKS